MHRTSITIARAALCVGAGSFATNAAAARPIYFHKAGVDRETFAAERSACDELAGGARAPTRYVYTPNLVSAAAAGLFSGFFGSRERRGLVDNILRTCMADKGYRRIEPGAALRRELAALPEAQRLDRLFVLAAAPEPAGTVLPR